MKTKQKQPQSLADKLLADVKRKAHSKEEQLETLRFWRDVTCHGNLKEQLACATAIDKLKGLY